MEIGLLYNEAHIFCAHILRTFLIFVCAQTISSTTTQLRTYFPSHLYELKTVSEYFNFTDIQFVIYLSYLENVYP